MSADLFAAFGTAPDQGEGARASSTSNNIVFGGLQQAVPPVDEEEDDFGEFQDLGGEQLRAEAHVTQYISQNEASGTADVLFDADDDGEQTVSEPVAMPIKPVRNDDSDLLDFGPVNTVSVPASTPLAGPVQAVQEDEWDDFATPTPVESIDSSHFIIPRQLVSMMSSMAGPESPSEPPRGIPPPSLLLSLFRPLFQSVTDLFLQPVTALSVDEKSTALAQDNVVAFLRSHLAVATVFAHILAGRRLRWKRDKYLAQSMSIGPSVSGRSGGMKLAGVDKTESTREEHQATDALRAWKVHVGRLRSVVSASNTSACGITPLPPIVDLALTMAVRTAKPAEGAIVSLHPCILCGLKREERVARVDEAIQDGFGEWWIENVKMHVTCWQFWDAQKDSLRSR